MSNEENVQVVKNFFAAIGSGDKQALLALVDEGIEWIIPGEDWPLAGTHRGHAGVAAVLRKAGEEIASGIRGAGRPGFGRWSRYWEDQGHH
jgi:ketosteroid isomerase-like protein